MPRPRSRRTLTGFRVVLLLSLIAAVAAVVGLYLFGAAGAPQPKRAADAPAFEEGTRLVGKDFDYTFSQGDKAVFRVRGESIRVDKDETVYLDQVGITLYDKEGRRFDAESDEGSINRGTNEGRMWGDVTIKGPSQLEIHSKQLLIQEKGNLLVTPGVARILYAGRYFARCESLQAWLPDEVYSLIGDVRIETVPEVQPPMKLEAEQVVYERKRRQIRVEENAELHRGTAEIHADRISGLLSPEESAFTFVRALYHVSGQTAPSDAPGITRTSWEGNDLAVMLAPAGNVVRQVDLAGTPAKRAVLRASGNALMRTLVAPHIEGVLADKDILRAAHASGGVDLEEVGPAAAAAGAGAPSPGGANRGGPAPAGTAGAAGARQPPASAAGHAGAASGGNPRTAVAPGARAAPAAPATPPAPQQAVRRAHGERGDAAFRPDGQIASVVLVDHVTYGDGEVTATGDRAAMDMDAGRGDFFGNPVDAVSSRGKLRAPHVIYTSADQLMHAVDGVHAQIEQAHDAALAGSVLGEGKGPVMVQSQEAFWRKPQTSFVFRGDVRAWRDDNLLLTPLLVGQRLPQGDQLTANGGVKSVWIPSHPEAAAGAGAQAPGAAAGARAAGSAPANAGAGAAAATGPAAGAAAGRRAAGTGAAPLPTQERGPITVLATDMLYRDGSGVLTYRGNVHVDQDTKTLACQQLDVNLDEKHQAKQMTCTGQTHLDDPATGRKIDGDSAVYRIEIRKIDILGNPVVMHDRDGNIVHGQRLRYSIDSGKVEVLGKDDGPKPAPAAVAPAAGAVPQPGPGTPREQAAAAGGAP